MKKKYSRVDIVCSCANDIVTTSIETGFIPFFSSSGIKVNSTSPDYSLYDLSDEVPNYGVLNPFNID